MSPVSDACFTGTRESRAKAIIDEIRQCTSERDLMNAEEVASCIGFPEPEASIFLGAIDIKFKDISF